MAGGSLVDKYKRLWYTTGARRRNISLEDFIYQEEYKRNKAYRESNYTPLGKTKTIEQMRYEETIKIKYKSLTALRNKYSLEEWKQDIKDFLNGKVELQEKFKKLNRIYG